ncbi:murein hydrolase activator EnvC family protein [Bordetella sp. 2513F-2]
MRRAAWVLLSALAALPPAVHAAAADLAARQSEAERQQAALRSRIEALQKEIDEREAARKEAADALKESESAISRINRRLSDLAAEQQRAEARLGELERQIAAQQRMLAQRRAELAGQLRAQYAGGLSPWTALLSGDDPQQLGRNLGYLGYVSRARAQAVQALRTDLARLAALQQDADARREEIAAVVAETSSQKTELQSQQKERAAVLARLEGQIQAQRVEAGKLGRDDQRLSRLIDDLDTEIARQAELARRAAEEAARRRAEAERQAAEAARRAEAARQAEQARLAAEQARRAAAEQEAARVREQAEAAARQPRGPVALGDPDAIGLRPAPGQPGTRVLPSGPATPAPQPEPVPETKSVPDPEAPREPPPPAQPAPAAEPPPARAEAQPERRAAAPVDAGRGLKRGLPVPVRGPTQGRFGVDRPDGGVWRGIVLRAPEGTPVKAVAPGIVVYSDWLRGFGNLIIVDHGQQYMTVYAYNQSVLKRVGDPVAAGDTIATVGATGGQVESGLYFEIRHRGAPVDPALWLAL